MRKYNIEDLMYGVFDEKYLSLRPMAADEEFDSLVKAFIWIAEQVETGSEIKYSVYPCFYSKKNEGWYPLPDSGPIQIDANDFKFLEDYTE